MADEEVSATAAPSASEDDSSGSNRVSNDQTENDKSEQPIQIEQITVIGKPDFCVLKTMKDRLNRIYEPSFGGLLKPGSNVCGKPECEQEFFNSGNKHVMISAHDVTAKTFKLTSGYAWCEKQKECEEVSAKFPGVTFQKNGENEKPLNDKSDSYKAFSLVLSLSENDLYDADFKNIEVGCPEASCIGYEFITKYGRMYYLELVSGSSRTKRLIVNAGDLSKIKKTGNPPDLNKCTPN